MAATSEPQPGLAAAIRELRTGQRLSQAMLGKRSELHPTWISHIESGRINPTYGNVRRIAHGLGVTLADLADLAEDFSLCYAVCSFPTTEEKAGATIKELASLRSRGQSWSTEFSRLSRELPRLVADGHLVQVGRRYLPSEQYLVGVMQHIRL